MIILIIKDGIGQMNDHKYRLMKKSIAIIFLLINTAFAQVKIMDSIPDLNFEVVLNAPFKQRSLKDFEGKIVLIEFWATWCGSCIEAMPHLSALQEKHKDKLQVLLVSEENPLRITQFLRKKTSLLWFVCDTTNEISSLFPHQLIPHSVLISPSGRLLSNSSPEVITDQIIEKVWKGASVDLPQKVDNLMKPEELLKSVFLFSDTIKKRFIIQGEIKGSGGLFTMYADNPVFGGRRATGINLDIKTLYKIAYGNFPDRRVLDRTGKKENKKVYSFDLIVENKEQLFPVLKKELSEKFELKVWVEKQDRVVSVLKITDWNQFKKIPVNRSGQRTYYARHGEIDQQSVTMKDFAAYLENYGSLKSIVLDETGDKQKFDVKFSFQPEDPESLKKILNDMGLSLIKENRTLDILVFSNQ
ncbi:uncharacterized protein (TIGR03435 family) [Pedobacter nutrimenti]|uniref:Uncharacterized protein (TIGR03435 family) n=2 Tax=Pedobacter nutrimenti TaxID=1241337 RepID=A0A318UKH6_9SPHI|nr:uncharacterized protein (TIGR03435 family) [Pedobacter nutrimenti]